MSLLALNELWKLANFKFGYPFSFVIDGDLVCLRAINYVRLFNIISLQYYGRVEVQNLLFIRRFIFKVLLSRGQHPVLHKIVRTYEHRFSDVDHF